MQWAPNFLFPVALSFLTPPWIGRHVSSTVQSSFSWGPRPIEVPVVLYFLNFAWHVYREHVYGLFSTFPDHGRPRGRTLFVRVTLMLIDNSRRWKVKGKYLSSEVALTHLAFCHLTLFLSRIKLFISDFFVIGNYI